MHDVELKPFREFFIRDGGLFCINGDPEAVRVTTYFFFWGVWWPDLFDLDWTTDGQWISMTKAFFIALCHFN
jgi:hypothetical protein